jgi:putative ABC transport system substrate-binding protein
MSLRRRDFFTLLGGAAAAWPLAARAQQQAMPVVGYLDATGAPDGTGPFLKGLSETGFIEGRNVAIEIRAADNDYTRLPELAADLVRHRVDVIYANGGTVAALAAKSATTSIPVVFAIGDDPVDSGLVASLSRPGGNVTGIAFLSTELGPKRLGLLNALVPAATRYALLVNPAAPNTKSFVAGFMAAADSIGRHIEVFNASSIREIDTAFEEIVRSGADAVIVGSTSLLNSRKVQLATLASHYRLPAMYYDRRVVEVGGLMSYGADILDAVRQAGVYVGRILKGVKPANLPVMQAAKFELAINLETAKTLGITVPPSILAIADEIIE